jgi:hypothetical protein
MSENGKDYTPAFGVFWKVKKEDLADTVDTYIFLYKL